MHRAGQRCFELLALIGSPQLLEQSYSPAGQDSWPNWTNLKVCQALKVCPVRPRVLSSWGITLLAKLRAADES